MFGFNIFQIVGFSKEGNLSLILNPLSLKRESGLEKELLIILSINQGIIGFEAMGLVFNFECVVVEGFEGCWNRGSE